jgi:hypothetical protein
MAKTPVKLILQWECDSIRKKIVDRLGAVRMPANNLERARTDSVAEFGSTEVIEATGRAICRCCGQKIPKGQLAIRFPFDFTGNGAWTGVEVQIHGDGCSAPGSKPANQAPSH